MDTHSRLFITAPAVNTFCRLRGYRSAFYAPHTVVYTHGSVRTAAHVCVLVYTPAFIRRSRCCLRFFTLHVRSLRLPPRCHGLRLPPFTTWLPLCCTRFMPAFLRAFATTVRVRAGSATVLVHVPPRARCRFPHGCYAHRAVLPPRLPRSAVLRLVTHTVGSAIRLVTHHHTRITLPVVTFIRLPSLRLRLRLHLRLFFTTYGSVLAGSPGCYRFGSVTHTVLHFPVAGYAWIRLYTLPRCYRLRVLVVGYHIRFGLLQLDSRCYAPFYGYVVAYARVRVYAHALRLRA